MQEICNNDRRGPPARIIHERLRPSRGSRGFRGRQPPPAYVCPPDTSSDLLCDGKVRRGTFWSPVPPGTVAVVGLPRPDEESLAGTRCTSVSSRFSVTDCLFLYDMHVFRPGVRELSGLALEPSARKAGAPESRDDVGIVSQGPPHELRPVILDHGDDRSLVDAQLIAVEPADTRRDPSVLDGDARIGQRRIERVEESIPVQKLLAPAPCHLSQRRDHDLRSEGNRARGGRRGDRAVVVDVKE